MAATDDHFSPKYEYAGHWLADGDPTPSDVTRHGTHVVSVWNNGAYNHVFQGVYMDDGTIKGFQTRRKLADNTTTTMSLTLTFLSRTSIRVDWVALDSNSDLTAGATGVSMITRVPAATPFQPMPAPIRPRPAPVEAPAAPPVIDPLKGVD